MLSYNEMFKLPTFKERLEYLDLSDSPHVSPRKNSQKLYKSNQWLEVRQKVIRRDLASDLGMLGVDIFGNIYVHHINPIDDDDISNWKDKLFDMDNLITVSHETHMTIHYKEKDIQPYVERKPGDTKLW